MSKIEKFYIGLIAWIGLIIMFSPVIITYLPTIKAMIIFLAISSMFEGMALILTVFLLRIPLRKIKTQNSKEDKK